MGYTENIKVDIYSHSVVLRLEETQRNLRGFIHYKFLYSQRYRDKQGFGNQRVQQANTQPEYIKFYNSENNNFHIQLLKPVYEDFKRFMAIEYSYPITYQETEHPIPDAPPVDFNILDKYKLTELQSNAVQFAITNPSRIILGGLKTGEGKSLVSLKTASLMRSKVLFVVRGQYVKKWVEDILSSTDIKEDEILEISGSSALNRLIGESQKGKLRHIKAIIIANQTMRNYLTDSLSGEAIYLCHPMEFCKTIGTRLLMIDEGHQDFHFNYRLIMTSHVEKILVTTATLKPDHWFLKKMALTLIPHDSRFVSNTVNQNIKHTFIQYDLDKPFSFLYINRGAYHHISFEKTMLTKKNAETFEKFQKLISFQLRKVYYPEHQKGYKALVFCATVEMCELMVEYLQKIFQDLKVLKYTGEDSYDNIHDGQIIVSTIGSSGVALNIPKLYLTINTISIKSSQSSLQALGRLRPLKDEEGKNVILHYMEPICKQIEAHKRNASAKKELFSDRVIETEYIDWGKI